MKRTWLILVAALTMLLAPVSAYTADVDGNGRHDMLVREGPFYPRDAGGGCVGVYPQGMQGPFWGRYIVRPPAVWPIWGLSRQDVAWRARFVEAGSGKLLAVGNWVYATTDANGTVFGGGPNVPQAMLGTNDYYRGGQHFEHDAAISVRGIVDVAWNNPRTAGWFTHSEPVNSLVVRVGGLYTATPIVQRNAVC
jgi:hypothetical protein